MTKHHIAIALAFATSLTLSGCDRFSNITAEEHIQRAKDMQSKGNLESGILELKNAIQKDPNNAQARMLLGEAYLKGKQGDYAEKELLKAKELGVNTESLNIPMGEALLLVGKHQKILAEIQPTSQSTTINNARILRIRGDALHGLYKWEEGCELYKKSLSVYSGHAPTHWGLSNCAVIKQDFKQAEQHLQNALKLEDHKADSWVRLGDFHRVRGKHKEATADYTNALKYSPNNVGALIARAGTKLTLGDEKGFNEDVALASKIEPKSILVQYMKALQDYRAGHYATSRDKLQNILKTLPYHYQSNFLMGMISYRLGNFETAFNYFNRLLSSTPANARVRFMLVRTLLQLDRADEAIKYLQPFLSQELKTPDLLGLTAEAYMKAKNFTKAQEYFERALTATPESSSLKTNLARMHFALGENDRAITELEQAIRTDMQSPEPDLVLILTRLRAKEYDKALTDLVSLEKKLPASNPTVPFLKGVAYAGKSDTASARKFYQEALNQSPTYMPAALNLALLEIRQNRPQLAQKLFESILDKQPENLQAMIGLAGVAQATGKSDLYVQWLNKAAKLHPESIRPHQLLTTYYLGVGQKEKALDTASKAKSLQPNDPGRLLLLAQTQLALGEFSSAVSNYTRLTTLRPADPMGYFALANAHMGANNPKAARVALERALILKPDWVDAEAAMVAVSVAEGKNNDALQLALRLQQKHPKSSSGYTLAGDLLMAKGNPHEAAAHYKKSYQLAKNGFVAISWAKALRSEGKRSDTYLPLTDWLKIKPGDDSVRLFYATVLRNDGKLPDAIEHFQYLLKKSPDNSIVLNELAITYHLAKDPRALETAETAYKLNPVPAIADTLATMLLELKQDRRALELLEKAVATGTRNPEIRYHYALALSRTGQINKAKQELKNILVSGRPFPQQAEAQQLLKQQ